MHSLPTIENIELLEQLRTLPQPSSSAVRMLLIDPLKEGAERSLISELEREQGMATRFVHYANSSFFGIPRKIVSLRNAVSMLGIERSQNLVALLTAELFYPIDRSAKVSRHYFWRQALTTGVTAQLLFDKSEQNLTKTDAFFAGVFLNIGQLALEESAAEAYLPVLRKVDENPSAELWREERSHLRATHADVSALLLERWGFSETVWRPVLYHHTPDLGVGPFRQSSYLLHYANHLSRLWLNPNDPRRPLLQPETRRLLQIEESDDLLLERLKPELTAAEELVQALIQERG